MKACDESKESQSPTPAKWTFNLHNNFFWTTMTSQIESCFALKVSTIRERDKKNAKYYGGDYLTGWWDLRPSGGRTIFSSGNGLAGDYKSAKYRSKSIRYYFRTYIGQDSANIGPVLKSVLELKFNYSCFSWEVHFNGCKNETSQ